MFSTSEQLVDTLSLDVTLPAAGQVVDKEMPDWSGRFPKPLETQVSRLKFSGKISPAIDVTDIIAESHYRRRAIFRS